MGAELYAFTDEFDAAAVIASILNQSFKIKMTIQMYANSK